MIMEIIWKKVKFLICSKVLLICIYMQLSCAIKVELTGPGLQPRNIVMPARYFFVNFTSFNEETYTPELSKNFAVEINGRSLKNNFCRVWFNVLDRKDGTFIVRYKVYETCLDLSISLYYKSKHIENSPFSFEGPINADLCNCPEKDFDSWVQNYECPNSYSSIINNLKPFNEQDMVKQVQKIVDKYHKPESTSFCHYVIKENDIYRDCYGKHVGFNMFADNILLSLARKVVLPNTELVINLGDWPLVHKGDEPLPVFSWCGSRDTVDIVMPTYDITESALENMGRVTLDTLSVQGNVEHKWEYRKQIAFWRGRDSRAERLQLIDIARENPELFNVSLTNFFFFRDKEKQYGPKQPHISFFKFFDYKYQINIDGTVAAYRFPYLLAGGGLVLKQDSPFHEHFYDQLHEWEHYVPVARNLSNLVQKIQWAQKHDKKAHFIAKSAQKFAQENLLPQHIICYHAMLLSEWSKRISSEVFIREGMIHVPQTKFECDCSSKKKTREEL